MALTPQDVRDVKFDRPPIGSRGYNCDEVDAFLDRVERALNGTEVLTAAEVREVKFNKPPLLARRGYDEDQVDTFLDRVEAELATRQAGRQAMPEPTLVVGLGNPGPGYAGNRHNVGFMVADLLAQRAGGRFKSHRSSGCEVLEGRLGGRRVVLAKPRTYMNLSGGPVVGAARFFKIDPYAVVVVHDDLDLPFGIVRLKRGGGEGGHNGLRSISKSFGSRDYVRVRFGIDRPPGRQDPSDYVLRDFSIVERRELDVHLETCADAVETLLQQGLEPTQNQFH